MFSISVLYVPVKSFAGQCGWYFVLCLAQIHCYWPLLSAQWESLASVHSADSGHVDLVVAVSMGQSSATNLGH